MVSNPHAIADGDASSPHDPTPPERPRPGLRLLVVGGETGDLPTVAGVTYVGGGEAFDAVALLEPVAADRLQTLLEERRRPFAPVAAFGMFEGARADFTAPALSIVTVRQALAVFEPIQRRLDGLPDIGGRPDREGLLALGLAHSRQRPIEAAWSPAHRQLVWYPLLGDLPAPRQHLEALADLGLMRRRFFQRLNLCGNCASSRLSVYEACVGCGSGQLAEEETVHHFACGHKAPESRFLQDRDLICPKCRKELRHFGVDYDRPGTLLSCQGCGTVSAEPQVAFACLDCGRTTRGDGVETADWFHYDLLPEGEAALREGRLPLLTFETLLTPFRRAYPMRDFTLLVREGLAVAQRYERPFSLLSLAVGNHDDLVREHGAARTATAFRLMVDLLAELIREPDLITADGDHRVLLGLPETSRNDAEGLVSRVREKISETIELPIRLDTRAASGDEAAAMLGTAP